VEGNIPLSYEGLSRGFNPRAIGTCPQDRHETSLVLPAIIRNNLGRIAATTLCAIAANGALGTDSAANYAEPAIVRGQLAGPSKNLACADPPGEAPARKQIRAMRCLVSQASPRTSIAPGPRLNKSARRKTHDVIRCGFVHNACEKPFTAYMPSRFPRRAENLAWGQGDRGSAQSIFYAWMRSQSHRRIILDKGWDRLGVAVIPHNEGKYWTAHFGDLHRRKK
jgi:hypothetical protein